MQFNLNCFLSCTRRKHCIQTKQNKRKKNTTTYLQQRKRPAIDPLFINSLSYNLQQAIVPINPHMDINVDDGDVGALCILFICWFYNEN